MVQPTNRRLVTEAKLSTDLGTKVNSATYTAGLAAKQDAASLVTDTASHVADGSALDVALRAALLARPASIPSTTNLAKPYEPRLQAYNLTESSLRRFRAALARGRSGGAPTRIFCAGDSITHGRLGDSPLYQNAYPQRLRALLNNFWGQPTADGVIWANGDTLFDDTRITLGSGWAVADTRITLAPNLANGPGGGGEWKVVNGTAPLTFAPGIAADTWTIYYYTGPTSFPNFTYDIDGGTATTVNPTAAAGLGKVTFTTTKAVHTLHINPAASGPTFIAGVEAYDSTARPVLVSAQGVSTTSSAYWENSSAYGSTLVWPKLLPDLVTIFLGMNDCRSDSIGVPVATYISNLTSLVNRVRANNGDVILIAPHNASTAGASGQGDITPYVAGLYGIADSLDVCVFDLASRWPTTTAAMAAPFSLLNSDSIHPTGIGQYDIAEGLFSLLRNAA